jgi:CheY-like chemotaxis protein
MPDRNTILVADDDPDILEGVRCRLHTAGFDTLEAHDGSEAVDAATRRHPDAILLDVLMPRMDGLSALRTLQRRQETKDIPVVVISASLRDRKAALDSGARLFLTKPYDGKTLLTAIRSVIQSSFPCPQPH